MPITPSRCRSARRSRKTRSTHSCWIRSRPGCAGSADRQPCNSRLYRALSLPYDALTHRVCSPSYDWETPMNSRALIVAVSASVGSAIAAPVFAHHSFAMFDQDKTVSVKGTVKEFEWVNPHAWIRLMVMDQKTN